jgi:hypothetical protein
MGRHTLAHKQQLEKEQQFLQESVQNKRTTELPTSELEEGCGEQFKVKVKKVGNGFIIENNSGENSNVMVFDDEKYIVMVQWIVDRRLKQMKPGEEIELLIEQHFTKIIKDDNSNKGT